MSKQFRYIEDKQANLTLDDILKLQETKWSLSKSNLPNFGFTQSVYWFKRSFETHQIQEITWLLEIPSPLLDSIEVYVFKEGMLSNFYHMGAKYQFNQRPIQHRDFLVPLRLSPHTQYTVIFRVHASDSLLFPVALRTGKSFFLHKEFLSLLLGMGLGCFVVMALYNMFLYFTTLQKDYLLYTAFILSAIYFESTQQGLLFQYFWPNSTFWNRLSVPISILLTCITSVIFVGSFLKLRKNHRAHFKYFRFLAGTVMLFFPFVFVLPFRISVPICAALGVVCYVSILISSILIWRKGVAYAKFIVLGWCSLIIGVATLGLSRFAIIPANSITEGAALIGAVIEAILASFGLGNRINYERNKRFKAQGKALQHELDARIAQNALLKKEKESKEALERLVAQRTQELSTAMDDLHNANRSLRDSSYRDPLTGLYNRRYLQENYKHFLHFAESVNDHIVIMFLDIDHFKKVNDTHGHLIGDLCITLVANKLRSYVNNDHIHAFRFGGEEFLLLMCTNELQRAVDLAEEIRQTISLQSVPRTNERISISIGVSQLHPPKDLDLEKLIQESDDALYEAKNSGRNRVVVSQSNIQNHQVERY